MYEVISGCRSCGHSDLLPVHAYGQLPLANALLDDDRLGQPEPRYPLTAVFCPYCSLVQILETVRPSRLFGSDFPYYSSFSDALVDHARMNVEGLVRRFGLCEDDLVVELASNDGYLLQFFVERGIPVLGIDPAPGPAQAAVERGVPTVCEFFTRDLAARLAAKDRKATLIIANNVLGHVPDPNLFAEAMSVLLADAGTVVVEVPYVRDLIDRCAFDTIYHEHCCYFSVSSAKALFERHGFGLVDLEHHPIHGGSLRAFFDRSGSRSDLVDACVEDERRVGLRTHDYYQDFAERVEQVAQRLGSLLLERKAAGNRISAYGAAAKGTILLNHTGIGREVVDYVVDRNVHKQGLHVPGVHLPIVPPERLRDDPPDCLLILAWNFKDEIMRQQAGFVKSGGRFIIPIPTPEVVT